MLTNLFKAVVAVALTPAAVVIDIVMLPFDAEDFDTPAPFKRTGVILGAAVFNVAKAIDPDAEVK